MVVSILRYTPNYDAFIACARCANFFAFLQYIFHRENRDGVVHLFIDPLYVSNCVYTADGYFRCVCGEIVGIAEELAILFSYYMIYEPSVTEGHDGLRNKLEYQLSVDDDSDLVAGCVNCQRPIGYGAIFMTRNVRSIDLMNVHFLEEVAPDDEFYYLEDGLRVMCRCGSYIVLCSS